VLSALLLGLLLIWQESILKPEERKKAVAEMGRVIKKGGRVLVMEHEVPKRILLRVLFYIRMYTMGSRHAQSFLRSELAPFQNRFQQVTKEVTPGGRSKLFGAEDNP
jgi:demethylphylloquinol methyltransferase